MCVCVVPLGTSTNVQLLEKIVEDQRDIFQDVFGNETDVATIPQMWCLCAHPSSSSFSSSLAAGS